MATPSEQHSHFGPRQVRPLANFNPRDFRSLRQLGIQISDDQVLAMMDGLLKGEKVMAVQDALQPLITTPSITTPIQFLQMWLPGFVYILTAARTIDNFVGITTAGDWEDEEIVQGGMERTGNAVPYSDQGNVPLASWQTNFLTRTIVRFEEGMRVTLLEEARSAKMRVNSAQEKRSAASESLEIQRNSVGFFGFNAGDNRTFGLLNDVNMPAFINFPNGASNSPLWSTKTFLEITKDIRTAISTLRIQALGRVDPKTTPLTMGLALGVIDFLSVTTDFGMSVQDWLDKAYPNIRVISAPEFDDANGGANVFYLYADSSVGDGSTDDGRTIMQVVPAKFRTLGVQQQVKGYEEDYSNATAGVLLKRPLNIVRFSGN